MTQTTSSFDTLEWGTQRSDRTVTFLAEPERRPRRYTIISVDDHMVEPPGMFDGRIPAKLADRAPRVVDAPDGRGQAWVYDGQLIPNVGFNAVSGRPPEEWSYEPTRFSEMRQGAWDIEARIHDMDVNGIYASVNFPSFLAGFAGQRLQQATADRELAEAVIRAYNDFQLEVWAERHPDRIIPCQLPWLLDPELAARMIYENAARGYKGVAFSEAPHQLGLPSLHTGYWDPFLKACAETGTVIGLHVGSAGSSPTSAPDAPPEVVNALFYAASITVAADWLFSLVPVRFPGIRIVLSEGSLGWVAGLMDRLDHTVAYNRAVFGNWSGDRTPTEVLQQNFWYCAISDPSAFRNRDRVGVEHILLECDYPHADSTWPDTQPRIGEIIGDLPAEDVRKLTWENAARLYRHPVPAAVQLDPEAF
jgi:predicted TIM-barrel fold metal-dependent hydrolase